MTKVRANKIIEFMKLHNDTASVSQLCDEFNVSDMTIRRDLQYLEKSKRVIRHHGGASLVQTVDSPFIAEPLHTRLNKNLDLKLQLAKLGASYLQKVAKQPSCSSIFIASGSTMSCIATQVDFNLDDVTLVTDNLSVSQSLVTITNNTVIMIGGQLILPSMNSVGQVAEKMISSFSYDYAFIGAAAIDKDGYVYTYNPIEAGTFFSIINSSNNIVVVADSTKIDKKAFVQLFKLDKGHTLITNNDITEDFRKAIESNGTTVITD